MPEIRIDKWLWAARVFRTRSLALDACRGGHVKVNGAAVKPGRLVRVGEIVVVQTAGPLRTLEVVGVTDRRVGAKLVDTLYRDHTPPEELERSRKSPVQQVLGRPKGAGRPTKRDRRMMERFLP